MAAIPLVYALGHSDNPIFALILLGIGGATLKHVGAQREMYVFYIALIPVAVGFPLLSPPLGAAGLALSLSRRPKSPSLPRVNYPMVLGASTFIVALVALVAMIWIRPGEGELVFRSPPWWASHGPAITTLAILAGSTVNGYFEEVAWRVSAADLGKRVAPHTAWLMFTSLMFGASHLYGSPGGLVGIAWTAAFGASMHALRGVARGRILPCVTVHVIADLIILWSLYG